MKTIAQTAAHRIELYHAYIKSLPVDWKEHEQRQEIDRRNIALASSILDQYRNQRK
jgi:hypothetical protein